MIFCPGLWENDIRNVSWWHCEESNSEDVIRGRNIRRYSSKVINALYFEALSLSLSLSLTQQRMQTQDSCIFVAHMRLAMWPFGCRLFLRPRFLSCVFLFFFFFFFGSAAIVDFVNCEQCIRALFTVPQITLFSPFFIKNGSHSTIYTFKNYFATVFSVLVFSFSKNKLNPNTPYVCFQSCCLLAPYSI